MKNKGITLIALVITIIIMLILVAVTVNYGIKSGLLSKAKTGTVDYKFKEEEDKIGEIRLAYKVDSETEKTNGKTLKEYLEKELSSEIEPIEENNGNLIIKFYNSEKSHIIPKEDDIINNSVPHIYIMQPDEHNNREEVSMSMLSNVGFDWKTESILQSVTKIVKGYVANDETYSAYANSVNVEEKDGTFSASVGDISIMSYYALEVNVLKKWYEFDNRYENYFSENSLEEVIENIDEFNGIRKKWHTLYPEGTAGYTGLRYGLYIPNESCGFSNVFTYKCLEKTDVLWKNGGEDLSHDVDLFLICNFDNYKLKSGTDKYESGKYYILLPTSVWDKLLENK